MLKSGTMVTVLLPVVITEHGMLRLVKNWRIGSLYKSLTEKKYISDRKVNENSSLETVAIFKKI